MPVEPDILEEALRYLNYLLDHQEIAYPSAYLEALDVYAIDDPEDRKRLNQMYSDQFKG